MGQVQARWLHPRGWRAQARLRERRRAPRRGAVRKIRASNKTKPRSTARSFQNTTLRRALGIAGCSADLIAPAPESQWRAHRTRLAGSVIRASVRLVTYRRACRLAYRLRVWAGEPAVAPWIPTGLVAPVPFLRCAEGFPRRRFELACTRSSSEKWSAVTMTR